MADVWTVAVTRNEYELILRNYRAQLVYALMTASESDDPNGLITLVLSEHEMGWALQSIRHEGIRFALNTAQVGRWIQRSRREFVEIQYRNLYKLPS